jgi:hypothetical protein
LCVAKGALERALFGRFDEFNVLFSGELLAILLPLRGIGKWRGEDGVVARRVEARAAWTLPPPCDDEISARLMIAQ